MKRICQRFLKRVLLTTVIIHLAMLSFATIYYVSNTGNDSNNGLSEITPWKTISKVNNSQFQAGDRILLKSGEVWFEKFYMPTSGKVGNNIVISSYGDGLKPEIRGYGELAGWTISANWSLYSTGVYRMSLATEPRRLWINGADKKENKTLTLTDDSPWNWDSNYLYIRATSNPATFFSSIVWAKARQYAVEINAKSNFELNGLNLSGGAQTIVIANGKNIIFDNCEIGYNVAGVGLGTFATTGDSVSNIIVRNCKFITGDALYYSTFRGIGINTTEDAIMLGRGTSNSKVYNNYFENWSHSAVYLTSLDASYPCNDNEIYNNYITAPLIDYSRGLAADYTSNGYNNSFHDNTVVKTSVRCQFNGNKLKVYNNIIDGTKGAPYPERLNVGNGISIEGYGTPATNMEIYNNTILNCAEAGIYITSNGSFEKSNNNIHDNNIFANGVDSDNGAQSNYQIYVNLNSSTINHNTFALNHLYSSIAGNIIYYSSAGHTAEGINTKVTNNGDIFSGNNNILKFGGLITNINDLAIEHNGTSIQKTIPIDQPMIDSKGNKYSKSVTIQPFSSVILMKDTNVAKLSTEYKSICEGASYFGWTTSGKYERTLTAKAGGDSIVTTFLTVNPKYLVTEVITINEGESYNGWTKTGTYSRTLPSFAGCDSIVTTNLTVDGLIIKQGSIAIPTHFIPVWQGENGINHMNLMVISSIVEDLPLSADDEIAVFSGTKCVGAVKLTQPIDTNNSTTFLTISASQDDGLNNGYISNDTIIFKIWDNLNQKEMVSNVVKYKNDISTWLTSGKYSAGATSVVEIASYKVYTQSIELLKGYNMISTYVSVQNPNVSAVTKTLLDQGNLIKMQDETGNSFENWGTFGGWINQLGSLEETEGYKIQVANNCTLQVIGRSIAMPFDISLKTGWNIISFPRTDMVNAMNVVQSLIDLNKLVKVQDEAGNSIENWGLFGGWKNGIGNFIPGKAYKVKMSADAILSFQESYPKSAIVLAKSEQTEYYHSSVEGNGTDHMNVNITGLNNIGISVGDELAAFDGTVCVAATKITEANILSGSACLASSFSTNDQNSNGFKVGDQIQILAWNKLSGDESKINTEVINGQMRYEKNASVLLNMKSATIATVATNLDDAVKIDVFPNPCQSKVTVRFSEIPEANSLIEISDISGRKLVSRLISGTTEEINLDSFTSGLYLVKLILGKSENVQKLIVNK